MAEDIKVFVVESSSDFVASITVDDNNVADTNLTGEEAYGLYAAEVVNLVKKYGGEFVFAGKVNRLMLGEVEDLWDSIAIAKYPSRKAMLDMTMDPEYQKIHIHRDAGLKGQLNIETV